MNYLDEDELTEIRAMIAERRSERERARPTPELLISATQLISLLAGTHPEVKGDAGFIGGQDWKHIVKQLRCGADYLRENP